MTYEAIRIFAKMTRYHGKPNACNRRSSSEIRATALAICEPRNLRIIVAATADPT
jgi:hypothetical protein